MARVNSISNNYVNPHTMLDYSRSVFKYSKTHSTNLLTGAIVPVAFINCAPGTTVPNKFGFILQSAPLLGPSLDNVYIDIISVWCPTRLVMADFNEWLGDNDTYAWTLGNNVVLPRIDSVVTDKADATNTINKTYLAEHFLAPHYGYRIEASMNWASSSVTAAESPYRNGIQVIPFRMYDLIWNRIFRNENLQNPVLFSKQSGLNRSLDISNYTYGLGKIRYANRMKDVFNTARISPSIQTVDLGLNGSIRLPVGVVPTDSGTIGSANVGILGAKAYGTYSNGVFKQSIISDSGNYSGFSELPVIADLSALTVNSLYYSIMLQKYMNKASQGRRPVEFYKNMFGISFSNASYDDPELLSQKRFKVNISRVVATANSTDSQSNVQPIGTQGAFSLTTASGVLFPEFTATEYGMLHVFAVIRTQESYSSGADKYLTDYDLLSTYLPQFDHIGEEAIEFYEICDTSTGGSNAVFGYQRAWYRYRFQVNDVAGILAPGEALDYMTLSRSFQGMTLPTLPTFALQNAKQFDRMLQFPVFYGSIGAPGFDSDGENYASNRYQWIIQFALAGDLVATMSKDSEPLMFGTRI